jgi:hypothetical protein
LKVLPFLEGSGSGCTGMYRRLYGSKDHIEDASAEKSANDG